MNAQTEPPRQIKAVLAHPRRHRAEERGHHPRLVLRDIRGPARRAQLRIDAVIDLLIGRPRGFILARRFRVSLIGALHVVLHGLVELRRLGQRHLVWVKRGILSQPRLGICASQIGREIRDRHRNAPAAHFHLGHRVQIDAPCGGHLVIERHVARLEELAQPLRRDIEKIVAAPGAVQRRLEGIGRTLAHLGCLSLRGHLVDDRPRAARSLRAVAVAEQAAAANARDLGRCRDEFRHRLDQNVAEAGDPAFRCKLAQPLTGAAHDGLRQRLNDRIAHRACHELLAGQAARQAVDDADRQRPRLALLGRGCQKLLVLQRGKRPLARRQIVTRLRQLIANRRAIFPATRESAHRRGCCRRGSGRSTDRHRPGHARQAFGADLRQKGREAAGIVSDDLPEGRQLIAPRCRAVDLAELVAHRRRAGRHGNVGHALPDRLGRLLERNRIRLFILPEQNPGPARHVAIARLKRIERPGPFAADLFSIDQHRLARVPENLTERLFGIARALLCGHRLLLLDRLPGAEGATLQRIHARRRDRSAHVSKLPQSLLPPRQVVQIILRQCARWIGPQPLRQFGRAGQRGCGLLLREKVGKMILKGQNPGRRLAQLFGRCQPLRHLIRLRGRQPHLRRRSRGFLLFFLGQICVEGTGHAILACLRIG